MSVYDADSWSRQCLPPGKQPQVVRALKNMLGHMLRAHAAELVVAYNKSWAVALWMICEYRFSSVK